MRRNLRLVTALTMILFTITPVWAGWRSEGPWLGSVKSLAIDPVDPSTLYAGTHNGGVWKSTDAGGSWQQAGLAVQVVSSIRIDPQNSKRLFAVTKNGVFRSEDAGASWVKAGLVGHPLAIAPSDPKRLLLPDVNRLHRSDDGGVTWVESRIGGMDVSGIAFAPQDAKTVYAVGSAGTGNPFRRSSDGGASWDLMASGLTDAGRAQRILVAPGGVLYILAWKGLYKSDDRGETWEMVSSEVSGYKKSILSVDPSTPGTLYATLKTELARSTDGGMTWKDISKGLRYLSKALAIHPESSKTLYAGDPLGVVKSTDAGRSWRRSNRGLAAWVKRLAADVSGFVCAGTSRGLFCRDDGGEWHGPPESIKKLDAKDLMADRQQGGTFYVTGMGSIGPYLRSNDAGKTWEGPADVAERLKESWPSKKRKSLKKLLKNLPRAFQCLAQDPANASVLYAGVPRHTRGDARVFRSSDGGIEWTPWDDGLPEDGVRLLRVASSEIVFALTEDNGIYRSGEGGIWTRAGAGLQQKNIHDLAVDPAETSRLYLVSEDGLYLSADSGKTWTASNQGLKAKNLRAVVVVDGHGVFVGGFHGVHLSADRGKSWTGFNEGLWHTDVRTLAVAGGDSPRLYAGTAGGSVFSIAAP